MKEVGDVRNNRVCKVVTAVDKSKSAGEETGVARERTQHH